MLRKTTMGCLAFLALGIANSHAQENISGAGGEASGSGGTSSYTVGQVVYTTSSDASYNISDGVQQPYEISETTGIAETGIELSMEAFPNPTTNTLTLVSEKPNLNYRLVDSKGAIIQEGQMSGTSTQINMQGLIRAMYFLHVVEDNTTIKTFKVVKN